MVDEEIGIVLSLKQKQAVLSGLREVQTALKGTGDTAESASQKAPIAASRWKRFQDRIDGMGGSMRNTGRIGGAMFGILVANSNGALGPIGEVYDRIAGVGTVMEQTNRRAGKWAIGLGAAMTGAGAVLGTIVSKDEAARNQLRSSITAAGGNYEDFRKQIEKNIHTGERYGDTSARTQSALNRLVLATRNPQEAFRLYNSVLQISAARHMDVEQVALLVGRAMHGQARSLQAFGFQLNSTQKQQQHLTSATKAHKSAVDEVAKAQQHLKDVEARLGASRQKGGSNALAQASGHLAVESATIAYSKAVYNYGKNSVQASLASQRLEIAQGRLNNTMSAGHKAGGLTLSQQITLRDAQTKLADAQKKVTDTGAEVAATQKDIAKQGDTADQIIQQTTKYMAGQASAQADTFTGHLHALAATLDDKLATGGSHVYKFLVTAGPAMMGLGAIIESGMIPKLGRMFLSVTGVQRALDMMKASEVILAETTVATNAEMEASTVASSSTSVGAMSRVQGAMTGVALAIGAYEIGTRVKGTKGMVGASLMGALAGMAFGFSVGGPWGAAIGGAIGLIGGLATAINASAGATERQNRATQQWMTTAYQADQFKLGQQFQTGITNTLQQSPDAAAALAQAGVNITQITGSIRAGNAVGGPAGLQLQAAVQAGKISKAQYTTALNALQTLVANFGAVATNLDSIAQITGVTSQHMTDVATGAKNLASVVYSMPTGPSYVPPTLTGLLTPPSMGPSASYNPPTLAGLLTPPGRARGGPVRAGNMYRVNESGQEYFRPSMDGYIIPHGATVTPLASGGEGSGMMRPTVVQLVLDRKVIGEATIGYVQDKAARR